MSDSTWKNGAPKCPNHSVGLVDCHQGIGICPVSNARFSYDAEQAEKKTALKINAFGEVEQTQDFGVKNIDGKDPT